MTQDTTDTDDPGTDSGVAADGGDDPPAHLAADGDADTPTDVAADGDDDTPTDVAADGGDSPASDPTDDVDAPPIDDVDADPLVVASLSESTGKTAIAVALGVLARGMDRRVGYMKPKGTRLQSKVGKTLDTDPMLARQVLDLDAEMHEMEPIVYSPTFVDGAIRGQEDPAELRERVRSRYADLAADADTMVLEGGGAYTTGGIVDLDDVDVAELLDARVLLVADYEEAGDVDAVLAAAEAFGDRLTGVVFNRVSDAAYDEVESEIVPFLERKGVHVVGVIPRDRRLAGVTVADLADRLGGKLLTDADTDAFVERFLVGAMSGDEALQYFRRTKDAAVITGGDRSDVHTAAIEAPGIAALVVTGGHHPSGAVLGRAEERDLPVMAVTGDTLSVVERAEEVVRSGRTRDEHTVDVMADLLRDHTDVTALLDG